ncbi:MAG: hypothetical protein R3234_00640 [Thermoanaerobaculia bacterium]|nr:hypothetical protein [Thermoanaerobaculia bacterium]
MSFHLVRELAVAQRGRNLAFLQPGFRHEIAGPLNALTLHVRLLQRAVGSGTLDPERVSRWTRILAEELGRAQGLAELWLETSAPDRPDPEPVPLGPVVDRLRELLGPTCREMGVDLTVQKPGTALELPLPRSHLEDILLDLTVAALERFERSDGGGTVEWSAGADERSRFLVITDDGPREEGSRIPAAWDILPDEGQSPSRFTLASLLVEPDGRLASTRTGDGRHRVSLRWPTARDEE